MAYNYNIREFKPDNQLKLSKKVRALNKLSEKLGKDVECILDDYSKINYSIGIQDSLNCIINGCMREVNRQYMYFINSYLKMSGVYKSAEIVSIFSELVELSYYKNLDGLSAESKILIEKLNGLPFAAKSLFLYMVDVVRIEQINEFHIEERRQIPLYSDKGVFPLLEHIYLEENSLLTELGYSMGLSLQDIEIAWFTAHYLVSMTSKGDSLVFWRLFILCLKVRGKNISLSHFEILRGIFFGCGAEIDILEYSDGLDTEIYNVETIKRKQTDARNVLLTQLKMTNNA